MKTKDTKQQITILVGISGAGKSTWTTQMCENHSNLRRVNRDDVRKQLVGTLENYYKRKNVSDLEKDVTEILNLQINYLLRQGYDLVIDNTHLSLRYINEIEINYGQRVDVQIKTFDCDLETAKRRVLKRDFNCITNDKIIMDSRVDYINDQYTKYLHLINYY